MALVCTPSQRLKNFPCLACLSDSELDAAFVVALAISAGYTMPSGTNQLLTDSACFTCLTEKQKKKALVSAYLEKYAPTITAADLRNRMKCLRCASPKQIKAAISFLTCKVLG